MRISSKQRTHTHTFVVNSDSEASAARHLDDSPPLPSLEDHLVRKEKEEEREGEERKKERGESERREKTRGGGEEERRRKEREREKEREKERKRERKRERERHLFGGVYRFPLCSKACPQQCRRPGISGVLPPYEDVSCVYACVCVRVCVCVCVCV